MRKRAAVGQRVTANDEQQLRDFGHALVRGIKQLGGNDIGQSALLHAGIAEPAMLPRDAFFAPKETVTTRQAIGRIAAEQITPYPPGIPVIIPGASAPRSCSTCAAAWLPGCSYLIQLIRPSRLSGWSPGAEAPRCGSGGNHRTGGSRLVWRRMSGRVS